MKKKGKDKKKKGIDIEFQDENIKKSFGFDNGVLPIFFGVMGHEIGKSFYQQKCRNMAAYCQPQREEVKRLLGENRSDSVLLIFNPRDPLGAHFFKLFQFNFEGRELPELMATTIDKSWVLRNLSIDIKIREKLREYNDLGVVVVSYGLIEVVL